MATSLWAMALAVLVSIIGTIAAVFVKRGSKTFSFNPLKLIRNYKLIFGFFLYGVSSILFILALRGGELSILFPLLSLGYIWIGFVSIKFLGERMTTLKWVGITFILAGVISIGMS
jgi:uncharacterized membrane protein